MKELYKKQKTGQLSEQEVCHFLESKGLRLLIRNYRCFNGEIDLIMQDGEDIVFVEVRTRNRFDFGNAFESVNYSKQNKLLKTAIHYLQKQNWLEKVNSRFDVVSVSQGRFDWIKNAFSTETL